MPICAVMGNSRFPLCLEGDIKCGGIALAGGTARGTACIQWPALGALVLPGRQSARLGGLVCPLRHGAALGPGFLLTPQSAVR
jgi:hypothetical protein